MHPDQWKQGRTVTAFDKSELGYNTSNTKLSLLVPHCWGFYRIIYLMIYIGMVEINLERIGLTLLMTIDGPRLKTLAAIDYKHLRCQGIPIGYAGSLRALICRESMLV
jgi:hypothetical protein